MNRKGKLLSKVLMWGAVLAMLVLTYKAWLPLPGTFLLVKDRIAKSDCIIPLGGDDYFRFRKAVQLYDEGYAGSILFTYAPEREKEWLEYYNFETNVRGLGEISNKEFALKAFKYFGKGPEGIYFTGYEGTSTYDEAIGAKTFMLAKGWKSLILVTSTYHMRRALLTFKTVFRGTGIEIYNCTAKNDMHDPYRWWRRERDVRMVLNEYVFIVYNTIHHFVLGKGKTQFDTY